MIYKMTLKDSTDEMTFNLLEVPIVDKDIEGAVDNVTLDGNQYTDYLYLKKQYIQKWSIMCDEEYERLRGFYTRQFDEAEIPTYELYYGETIYNDYALSGDYILADVQGVEPARMSLAQLNGNATQTTYSGENLLPPTEDWAQTINGVTIKVEGGVYTFSGTSTSGGTSNTWKPVIAPYTIQAGDYYHLGNEFASSQIQINIYFTDGTMQNASFTTVNRIFDLSPHVGKTISQLRIYWNAGNTFNGVAKPMILHNVSTQTAFEPYVGGIPAPNPSYPQPISVVTGEQNIEVVGKNLVEDTISGSSIDGNGIIRSNSDFDTQVAFVIEGETYTLSYTGGTVVGGYFATKPTVNSVSIDGTRIVNNNKTFVAQYTGYFTFRTNAGESNAQCELGNQATSYQAYTEHSFTIDLGNEELAKIGNYQDRIYKDGEKWYVEKQTGKVVLDGTEAWGYNGTDRVFVVSDLVDYMRTGFVPMSDYYTGQEITAYSQLQDMHIAFLTSTSNRTVVKNTNYTTANDFKTWLSTHNTTVYYALATPTTTEITDQTLIDQLEALTNVSITTGIHNIFTEVASGNLNPIMIFDFIEVVSRRVTLVPETPVRLTLTDGGIINACGCRKDVQLTMRETIE